MKVLVLHASALHLGFLGCYGNTWIATPILDSLAAQGVVFDQHFADHLGRRTCFTGHFDWKKLQPSLPPSPQGLLSLEPGGVIHIKPEPVPIGSDASPLEQTLERAADAMQMLAARPRWLCWVDLPGLYPPWQVSEQFTLPYLADDPGSEEGDIAQDEPFEPLPDPEVGPLDDDDLVIWERLRCTYAGAVTYLDAGLGLLFEELKERGIFDELTVIFTADRGLALGEHRIIGDWQPWLHDEVVHLPLIVRRPGGVEAGLRVFTLTQPVDLAATLLDLFGIAVPPMDGRSWLPLLGGATAVLREEAVTAWKLDAAEEWSLRTLDGALLLPVRQQSAQEPRPVQLFLKPEDRWEVNNVLQHHMELAEEMETRLRRICGNGG